MTTTCSILFGGNDIAIKANAGTPTLTNLHEAAAFDYLSDATSRVDTTFLVAPTLDLSFGTVHSIDSLTLTFTGGWVTDFEISFYNASNVLIYSDEFFPTGSSYIVNHTVLNFKRIVITIYSTNLPSSYARFQIYFGSRFTGEQIRTAQIVEQINPLSVELPVNTLEFTLFSSDGDFSIVNPMGVFANLQYKEPVDVYEDIDSVSVYMGRFYLDTWESISENEAKFSAIDAIGIMDGIDYLIPDTYDPVLSSPVYADGVVEDICDQAGILWEDQTLGVLGAATVSGWVPVVSCREALQQVLFRIGCYATCSRSDLVQIRVLELADSLGTFDHVITSAQKGLGKPVQLRPLVTGVEVTSHDYAYDGSTSTEILRLDPIATGTHIVKFDQPYINYSYGMAPPGSVSQTAYSSAWIEYLVSVQATLIITGAPLTETKSITGVYSGVAGVPDNIVSIDATTIIKADALTVAQRAYDYYAQRYLQKTKLFGVSVAPGDAALVASQGKWITGIIERMETDLAGGFVSNVDIVGVIYGCDNVLTANTTATANLTYTDCLDMLDFNLDLQDYNLTIN